MFFRTYFATEFKLLGATACGCKQSKQRSRPIHLFNSLFIANIASSEDTKRSSWSLPLWSPFWSSRSSPFYDHHFDYKYHDHHCDHYDNHHLGDTTRLCRLNCTRLSCLNMLGTRRRAILILKIQVYKWRKNMMITIRVNPRHNVRISWQWLQ